MNRRIIGYLVLVLICVLVYKLITNLGMVLGLTTSILGLAILLIAVVLACYILYRILRWSFR